MTSGTMISGAIAIAATLGLTVVFINNSSPYLKVNEIADSRDGIHVVGKIVPGTLKQDAMAKRVTFELSDETGKLNVVYTGPSLSNLESATQVVAIGAKKGNEFKSEKMLVKCPSKYESDGSKKS